MSGPRGPLPTRVQDTEPLPDAYAAVLDAGLRDLGLELTPDARAAIDAHARLLLAWTSAINLTKPGGHVGIVGVPQSGQLPNLAQKFMKNVTVAGGIAPTQANMHELLPDVMDGRIEPGKVFDRTIPLDETPDGYRAMNDREALKVLVQTTSR